MYHTMLHESGSPIIDALKLMGTVFLFVTHRIRRYNKEWPHGENVMQGITFHVVFQIKYTIKMYVKAWNNNNNNNNNNDIKSKEKCRLGKKKSESQMG